MRFMVRMCVVFLLLCAGTAGLWAGGDAERETAFTVEDARGRSVAFSEAPRRIIIAGRGAIPIVDAAYLFPEGHELVFSMVRCDQGRGSFAAALDGDFLETTFPDHNLGPEDVVALEPDCVLMKSYMAGNLGEPLEHLGIPVVYVDLESPEQFGRDVRILGVLLENEERAEEVLAWYEKEADAVAKALSSREVSTDPRVLFVYHSQKGGSISFNVPPAAWLQSRLVEEAGGVPVWTSDAAGKGWMKVGIEQIAGWDPDVIFLTDYFSPVDEVKAELIQDGAWKELRAVREGRLYAYPSDFYSWDQPDSRWILALKWMAAVLHPEETGGFRLEEDVVRFFRTMYGMDRESVDEIIISRLIGDVEPR